MRWWFKKPVAPDDDSWVEAERAEAERAVQHSRQQLDSAQELAQESHRVSHKFRLHRQRNMFAEGFRRIIREAHE